MGLADGLEVPTRQTPVTLSVYPTVARHIFQACPVWIYTQSNITHESIITLCYQKYSFSLDVYIAFNGFKMFIIFLTSFICFICLFV
jgi:hypothetical protein